MPEIAPTVKKAAAPSFYASAAKASVQQSATGAKSQLPLFAVLILVGVAIIFVLRNRDRQANTGPALTLVPSNDSDASSIANLTQSAQALTRQITPGGGVSTPLAPSPNIAVTRGSVGIITATKSVSNAST